MGFDNGFVETLTVGFDNGFVKTEEEANSQMRMKRANSAKEACEIDHKDGGRV